MPIIQAVLFDYGLVLSGPPDPLAWRRLQTILKANDPELHDAYWRHRHNYDLGVLDGPTYWRTVAADLNRPLDGEQLSALIEADVDLWTQPNQPMIDWAQSLQTAGIRTAILSNMPEAVETGIVQRCPWLAHFAHHTFSHRLRIAKPDARIYRDTISALEVTPHETLFIDDRIENVDAARALGIHAIQYLSHDGFLLELESCRFSGLAMPARVSS
jgi:putative hydrolase of the HAD superfamily